MKWLGRLWVMYRQMKHQKIIFIAGHIWYADILSCTRVLQLDSHTADES